MFKRYVKPQAVDTSMLDRSLDHIPLIRPTMRDDYNFRQKFYETVEWKNLRNQVLAESKQVCSNCKRTNLKMCVDHILPIKHYWGKRLDRDNLQLLCGLCNAEKQNSLGDSWRKSAMKKIEQIRQLGLPSTCVSIDSTEIQNKETDEQHLATYENRLNKVDIEIEKTKQAILQKPSKSRYLTHLLNQRQSIIRQLTYTHEEICNKGKRKKCKAAFANASGKIVVIHPTL